MSVAKIYAVSLMVSKPLVDVLKMAARVALKQTRHAALQHVQVSFAGNDMTVESTDLNIYFKQIVFLPELDVTQPFSVMVHRDAILSMKAKTEVHFNADAYAIDGIRYTPGAEPMEMPKAPNFDWSSSEVNLAPQYFSDLAACAVSASTSEVRPILTTICHRGSQVFATDGLRLCATEQNATWEQEVNLPAQHATLLEKVFGKSGAYMSRDQTYARYRGNESTVIIRLVDGYYPDISRIIPKSHQTSFTVSDTKAWVEACDKALLVHKQQDKENRDSNFGISLRASETSVEFAVTKAQTFSCQLPVSNFSGKPFSISCNAQYLKDALLQVEDGAQLQFNGDKQPVLLSSSPSKPHHRTALVSPISSRKEAGK